MKKYKLVNNYPVAKFYYKGNHSHPVRRTVLVTESNDWLIIGYEVRAGSEVYSPAKAKIKSYSRAKIAKIKQLRASMKRDRVIAEKGPNSSTLERIKLSDFLFTGP
jgi:hypothetical protein